MFYIPKDNGFKERKEWQKNMRRMFKNIWETYQESESKKCFAKKILLITVKVSKKMTCRLKLNIRQVSTKNRIKIIKMNKNNRTKELKKK